MISFCVVVNLPDPESVPQALVFAADTATVPEAPVNEYDRLPTRQYHVWLASQTLARQGHVSVVGEVSKLLSPQTGRASPFGAGPVPIVGHSTVTLRGFHYVHM